MLLVARGSNVVCALGVASMAWGGLSAGSCRTRRGPRGRGSNSPQLCRRSSRRRSTTKRDKRRDCLRGNEANAGNRNRIFTWLSRHPNLTKNRNFHHRHWTCVSTAAGVCVLVCCCEGVRIAVGVVGVPEVARGAARHRTRARTSRLRIEGRLIAFATRIVAVLGAAFALQRQM